MYWEKHRGPDVTKENTAEDVRRCDDDVPWHTEVIRATDRDGVAKTSRRDTAMAMDFGLTGGTESQRRR
ncbi:hypothetical protein E2562_010148 [Oryza meyeriana var. granulata]|uniref:Uncharacterized protein n=1 Tax=Oryza meyeriana var. granulata TaxID=110450 RepID=A0A6G1EIK4_9ORYZ|nr:hypothetical protein E2562_010148 [Oryza meyeriana var. granulata]